MAALTQALAYRGIMKKKQSLLRPSSSNNIQLTREAVKWITGHEESDATIWLSLRQSTIRPKVRQFLFKTMHEVFKIGEYWNRIPDIAERSICSTCRTTESMSHILSHCRSDPNKIIWDLAKTTWPHNDLPWPGNDLGTILGCGCITAQKAANQNQNNNQNTSNAHLRGATCLLHILISESAFLIWVLRCERVIHEKIHSHQEIKSKWLHVINERLTEDKINATQIKRNKGFTKLVVDTWEKVLEKEGALPNAWTNRREVLVGSRVRP